MERDTILKEYLDDFEEDDTRRFVKKHSSPTIEMRIESLTMCLEILQSVPEPIDSTEKLLWRQSLAALGSCKTEISRNDVDSEWEAIPMASSRSSQHMRKVRKGFTYDELKNLKRR